VVENFQGTPAVGDGLAIMTEAYQRLDLAELAATSLDTLKLNYPDHRSLRKGEFVPLETEDDTRSWLSQATLGLIDSETAPADPGRANRDVLRQYENAVQDLPEELRPVLKDVEQGSKRRSWFSYLTFGLFD
jgi:outer membrane protein assembly factor BamD